jgi:uncharacterized BrkB/YihY/UPF0761 family membrane protein
VLGGVIILLTWLYLSVLAVLFGAAITAQSEKQIRRKACRRQWDSATPGRPTHLAKAKNVRAAVVENN